MIKFSVPAAGIHDLEGLDALVEKAKEQGHQDGRLDASQRMLTRIKKEMNDPTPLSTEGEAALAETIRLLNTLPNDKARRRVMKKIKYDLRDQRRQMNREFRPLKVDLEWLRKAEAGLNEMEIWLQQPFKLEKPPTTMLHNLRQELCDNKVYDLSRINAAVARPAIEEFDALLGEASVFVVEHNWAAAFANAGDYVGGEFHLPDEVCAFEFRVSGRHVIAIAVEHDGAISMEIVSLTVSGWMMAGHIYRDHGEAGWLPITRQSDTPEHNTDSPFATMLGQQIKAVAIALDAEVAASEVVRAPHRLNQAREKRGKLPIYDYHMVSLARRSRPEVLPRDPNAEPGTRKRLHFRRGHWRHYDTSKTWIRWCLVGDPELGFIDKHYKL